MIELLLKLESRGAQAETAVVGVPKRETMVCTASRISDFFLHRVCVLLKREKAESEAQNYNRCDRGYPRRTPMETPGTDWATSAIIVQAAYLCLVHEN